MEWTVGGAGYCLGMVVKKASGRDPDELRKNWVALHG